jgi:hypothetical protein
MGQQTNIHEISRIKDAIMEAWSDITGSDGAETVFARVSPSVLRVEADLFDVSKRVGSGFLTELEGKKFILTNRHSVDSVIRLRIGVTESALEDVPSYQVSRKYDLAMTEPPPGMRKSG